MLIGERVKLSRINNNLTQSQLGDIVGVSKAMISTYENNFKTPSITVLERLSDTLGVDIDYLLGRDISAVNEAKEIKISSQDLDILNTIKNNRKVYHELYLNPDRTIKIIEKSINKNKK